MTHVDGALDGRCDANEYATKLPMASSNPLEAPGVPTCVVARDPAKNMAERRSGVTGHLARDTSTPGASTPGARHADVRHSDVHHGAHAGGNTVEIAISWPLRGG